jgi:UDP-glucose:(heptosyl)LPS alpha-1,3-glucosyltransferase
MVVVDLLEARRVGSERRYGELIQRLRGEGCEIHLFARRWEARAAVGLACHRVPVAGPAAILPLVFAVSALAVTRRWRGRLDLVHSHTKSLGDDIVSPGGSAHRAYVGLLQRESAGLRRLALPWHPYHRSMLTVERFQLAQARRIVVNSGWSRSVLAGAYPRVRERVAVVHNGVDTEHFTPTLRRDLRQATRSRLGLGAGETVFLFVGAGDRRKGLHELLSAFAGLAARPVRLVVLGRRDPKEAARIAATLARLTLGDRVVLQNFAPDPRPYYAAADAFVLPTKFDPFSNATAEALACGLPVVTTASNGVSELMVDGREGFVVPDPRDVAALRLALERVLEADRARMGEAARALAETLTWKRHVDAMLGLYGEVLGERR